MSTKLSLEDDQPRPSLRERKKAKTRAAIQEHALRLIHEQGYDETTVEQIADAAEVSPSTFFRYFPTKEDVVLYDAFDPILIEEFRAQPPEVSPIQAMRAAIHKVFGSISPEDLVQQGERARLIFSVPELRAAMLDQVADTGQLFSALLAERLGRPPDDFQVRVFLGALVGAMMGALLPVIDDPDADFYSLMDDGLAYLEAGLPL
jgi:AcrR family transcriptional regulator